MNPSERNKCRYSLVILVIESSSPKIQTSSAKGPLTPFSTLPLLFFSLVASQICARLPQENQNIPFNHTGLRMRQVWSSTCHDGEVAKGWLFLIIIIFLLFSILQGLYKSCSPRVKKIQRPSMNRIQNVQIMTLFYFFQMYARCEYDATKKGWERGSKWLQNRCVKI